MEQQHTNFLGEEKLSKLLFKFSIPCIIAMIIGNLYSIVDQIFIGNSELGYLGNAATGISFPIICFCNAVAWCFSDGLVTYVSIKSGKNETDKIHKALGSSIVIMIVVGIIISIVCLVFAEPLMWLFGASNQTINLSVNYFKIIALFFPIYLLISVLNSAIRADGSPTYAMIASSSGALINIILDPIFIFGFKLGIEGAAYATVIGQVISLLLSIIYLFKTKFIKLQKDSFKVDYITTKEIVIYGGASFVAQIAVVIMSLTSNILLSKYGMLSKYGPDIPISVFNIVTKVYTIVLAVVTGVVLGAQTIFGYNYGARKFNRLKKLYKMVFSITIIISLISTIIFFLFPNQILLLFGSEGNELIFSFGKVCFRIYLILFVVTCLSKLTVIFFQSVGKTKLAVGTSLIRDIVIYVLSAILLSIIFENIRPGAGIYGLLIAAPLADIITLVMIIALTKSFFKNITE